MESEATIKKEIQRLRRKLKYVQQQRTKRDSKHHKTILATVDDKTYTLQELARKYGFALSTLRNRYHQGKRDSELVRPIHDHPQKWIMFNGKPCTLRRLSELYGLNLSTIYNRYYRYNKRGYELIRPVNTLSEHRVIVYGKVFSLRELSQIRHIHLATIEERYRNGERGEGLLQSVHACPTVTYVPVRGHAYSLWELSQMYHIKYPTIKERFYRYHRRDDDLLRSSHLPTNGKNWVEIDGHCFTLPQLARKHHIKYATLTARYRNGERGERLIRSVQNSRMINIAGKAHDIEKLSHKYHLPVDTIRYRYYNGKRGWDLLFPKHKHSAPARVTLSQHVYTLSELSDLTHIKYSKLSNRYYHYHLRGKELIHPPFLDERFSFYGQTFSIPQLARRYGKDIGMIIRHFRTRYDRGERGYGLLSDLEDQYGKIILYGHHYTIKQLSHKYQIKASTLYQRYYRKQLRGEALIYPTGRDKD